MRDPVEIPTGGALYEAAADRFHAYQAQLHELLMSIHPGTWDVGQAQYGAFAQRCAGHPDGAPRYRFRYLRRVLTQRGPEEIVAQSLATLRGFGLAPLVEVYGSGSSAQHTVIVRSAPLYDEIVVSGHPATGRIRVSAATTCMPGDPGELNALVFPGPRQRRISDLQPTTEGPESTPLFYFPPGEG